MPSGHVRPFERQGRAGRQFSRESYETVSVLPQPQDRRKFYPVTFGEQTDLFHQKIIMTAGLQANKHIHISAPLQ